MPKASPLKTPNTFGGKPDAEHLHGIFGVIEHFSDDAPPKQELKIPQPPSIRVFTIR